MIRIAILGSTRGTSMLAIIDAIQKKQLMAQIGIVLTNKQDALILTRATANQLANAFVDPQGLTRLAYDKQISTVLHQHQIDLVVLVGYMRILSTQFVEEWENKVINVHPSLLPAFAGKMDLDVHHAVLAAKVNETGCTVHYVTKEVDAGPIILQARCPVFSDDTAESIKQRVQQLEGTALVAAIKKITMV
jgi:phosphoribosylglycinamide formyltransferase-1